MITQHLHIPTIGIGSGRYCDGQVLVVMDLLGISLGDRKMFKRYEQLRERSLEAFHHYAHKVRHRIFLAQANTFNKISEEDAAVLAQWIEQGMPMEIA